MKLSRSKILFIISDVIIAVYLVLAFSSFNRKAENKTLCNKVNIEIADGATNGFIDTKIIKERLQKTGMYPVGKPIASVDVRSIEEMLCKSAFVQTAECYKTEGGHVYISVTQRMPVIRIKADNGDDYYVDDNDRVMPMTRYISDLIIATGSIDKWYATRFLSPLGKVIMANEMWRNLIEQIHVLPDHGVELVPRIGDHIVYVGKLPDGKGRTSHLVAIKEFMTLKMTRLEKFYKYGLSTVGWNKYSYIDIEFDNQIICRKRSETLVAETQPQPSESSDAATEQPQDETIEAPDEPTSAAPDGQNTAKKETPKTEKVDKPKAEHSASKDKSSTTKDKNSVSKDKTSTSKDKSSASKDKTSTSKDKTSASKDSKKDKKK